MCHSYADRLETTSMQSHRDSRHSGTAIRPNLSKATQRSVLNPTKVHGAAVRRAWGLPAASLLVELMTRSDGRLLLQANVFGDSQVSPKPLRPATTRLHN